MENKYDVTIVIVNYNVKAYLANLLESIRKATSSILVKTIVIDNASIDGSIEYVESRYPEVHYIKNKKNVGFGRANNQAIPFLDSKYTLLLNPDTIIQEDTLFEMFAYMESNPQTGLSTCRLLNDDGSYSKDAIRNVPNLWTALMRVLGITELFPNSKWAGSYFISKSGPEKVIDVPVISGSFMFIRTELFVKLHGFDDRFFMYFEDTDLCFRVKEAGFKIQYVPNTSIIHFRGESTKKHSLNHHLIFNKALYQFYEKNYSSSYSVFSRLIIFLGILFRALLIYSKSIFSLAIYPFIDLLVLNSIIIVSFFVRYELTLETIFLDYDTGFFAINVMSTLFFISFGSYYSLYKQNINSAVALFKTMLFTFASVALITFFLKDYAFSRLIILGGGFVGFISLLLLRITRRKRINASTKSNNIAQSRVLIVGVQENTASLIQKIRSEINWNYQVVGLVSDNFTDEVIKGVHIVGKTADLVELVSIYKINEVFFEMNSVSNQKILQLISKLPKNIFTRFVPNNQDFLLGKTNVNYFGGMPIINLEIPYQNVFNRVIKRMFDMFFSILLLFFGWPFLLFSKKSDKKKLNLVIDDKKEIQLELPTQSLLKACFSLITNIFKGKISFVGAPMYLYDQSRAFPEYKIGVFGYRQLMENEALSESEKEQYELFYIQNYAIWLDLEILLKSVKTLKSSLNTTLIRIGITV